MSRHVLIAPTSAQWAEQIAKAKGVDRRAASEMLPVMPAGMGQLFDHDASLCATQHEQARAGYAMVEVATNMFGYCVRDTMNDGMGTIYGGRSRPGTTREEAIAFAAAWHAERPTHREVILGYERDVVAA